MLRVAAILELTILLMCSSLGTAFAQDEEAFIREGVISKRDAVALSVLFPGLGQMTQGQKVKGISMFIGEAASLVLFINAHENYKTKGKLYDRDLMDYENLGKTATSTYGKNYRDAMTLYKDIVDENDELDNLNSIRNTAIIVAAGVYVYNLVDIVFFSSSNVESGRVELQTGKIHVDSVMIDRTPGIMLTKRF